jgi:hypothetical protein
MLWYITDCKPQGMLELIQKDADKTIDDLF